MRQRPYDGNLPYIFISYAHRDSEFVMYVINELQSAGYRIWYDEGIEVGTEWPDYIAKRIMNCSVFLAFVSNHSVNSQNCKREIDYAIKNRRDPVAIYLEKVNLSAGMDMQLGSVQNMYYNRFSSEKDFVKELIDSRALAHCRNTNTAPTRTAHEYFGNQYSKTESTSQKSIETMLDSAENIKDFIQGMSGSIIISVIAIIATIVLGIIYATMHCRIMSQDVITDPSTFSFALGEFPNIRLNGDILKKYWVDLLLGAAFVVVSFFTVCYLENDVIRTIIYISHIILPLGLVLVFVPQAVMGKEALSSIEVLFENFESYFIVAFLSALRLLLQTFVGFFACLVGSSD